MSGAAGTTATPESLLVPDDALRHRRRRSIEEAYEAAYKRTIRHDTLAALEDVVRWLDCHGGTAVFTTVLRAAREIGWPVGQGNYSVSSNRVRQSLYRRLDMLAEMRWIDSWSGVSSRERGNLGIVIHLRRDSSVGQALSLAHPPRQLSFTDSLRVVVGPGTKAQSGVAAGLQVASGSLRLVGS
jgi:hypothetical protein